MSPADGPAASEGGKPTIIHETGPLKGQELILPEKNPLNEGQKKAAEVAEKIEGLPAREALGELAGVTPPEGVVRPEAPQVPILTPEIQVQQPGENAPIAPVVSPERESPQSVEQHPIPPAPTIEVPTNQPEQPGLTPPASTIPETTTQTIDARAEAILAGDEKFKEEKKQLEDYDKVKKADWDKLDAEYVRTAGESDESAEKNAENMRQEHLKSKDSLKPDKRVAYEAYKNLKRSVASTERNARITVIEEDLKNGNLKQEDIGNELAELVKARLEAEREDKLANDTGYRKAQQELSNARNKIRDRKEKGGSVKGIVDLGNSLFDKEWKELEPREQRYFADDKKLFNDYKHNMGIVLSREQGARTAAVIDNQRYGYRLDGSIVTGTDEEKGKEFAEEIRKVTEHTKAEPGRFKKAWKGVSDFFDRNSKDEKEKAFNETMKYAKLLKDNYGGVIKGLFFPKGSFDEKDQATVENLRGLMKESFKKFVKIGALRGLRMYIIISLALLLCSPILVGQVLEKTKPFGGNAG